MNNACTDCGRTIDARYTRCRPCHFAMLEARPFPHGTANGYGNRGCRCPECTEAWRIHHKEWTGRQSAPCIDCGGPSAYKAERCDTCHRKAVAARHGTESMYGKHHRCRCDLCRQAATDARRARRQRQEAKR